MTDEFTSVAPLHGPAPLHCPRYGVTPPCRGFHSLQMINLLNPGIPYESSPLSAAAPYLVGSSPFLPSLGSSRTAAPPPAAAAAASPTTGNAFGNYSLAPSNPRGLVILGHACILILVLSLLSPCLSLVIPALGICSGYIGRWFVLL